MNIIVESTEELNFNESFTGMTFNKLEKKDLSGIDIFLYVLSVGGGVVFVELSKVLTSLIKKDDVKSIKIGDVEIKGFSEKEVGNLLKKLPLDKSK